MKTLISLILDSSGSMAGKESDVIGGVNGFIRDQKKLEGDALLSLQTFSNRATYLDKFLELSRFEKELSTRDYVPRGNTALLDVIGNEIRELDLAWSKFYPDKTIVVIVTDGEENASTNFSKSEIQNRIRQREESGKWHFIYMGASVNAFTEARDLGFIWANTAKYSDSGLGTQTAYGAVSASVSGLRGGAFNAALGGVLAEDKIKIS